MAPICMRLPKYPLCPPLYYLALPLRAKPWAGPALQQVQVVAAAAPAKAFP